MPAAVWSNTAVDIQSALGTAVVVTGITKANPGVVSYTDAGSSDPTDGAYVVFPDLEGMTKMRDRVARVANVSVGSDTFELEGINTSSYSTFSSGNFQVITFGNSISTFTDVNASGGETNYADATTIHDSNIVEIPTTTSPLEIAFESQYDAGSAALAALNVISDNQTRAAVRLTLSNNNIIVFYGYITATLIPTGSAQELVTTNVTVKATGRITAYAA